MQDAVKAFAEQFTYEPVVENADKLPEHKHYFLTGMGGSHLAADLLQALDPKVPIMTRRDYGLPKVPDAWFQDGSLVIASSFSGNTEESVAAYDEAREKGYAVAAIATGGKLIEKAKADGVPYVQLPNIGIQPRSGLGFSFVGLMKLMGREDLLAEAHKLADALKPEELESHGQKIAESLKGKVPLIYTSAANETVAWNWKIKLNETGKVPAFYNVLPELNHNEMTGFDVSDQARGLVDPFYVIILKDSDDHPKILKRMETVEKLYKDRNIPTDVYDMMGESRMEKIFTSLLIADWTAIKLAEIYGHESEQVPMVEEFKKMIA